MLTGRPELLRCILHLNPENRKSVKSARHYHEEEIPVREKKFPSFSPEPQNTGSAHQSVSYFHRTLLHARHAAVRTAFPVSSAQKKSLSRLLRYLNESRLIYFHNSKTLWKCKHQKMRIYRGFLAFSMHNSQIGRHVRTNRNESASRRLGCTGKSKFVLCR